MTLQTQARLILYLLGGGIVALIVALVLGAIAVSGVISMTAANVFLWIAISVLGISLAATAVIYCPILTGPKAALLMLLLVAVASAGWYGRTRLSAWLLKKKAEQQALTQISAPPPSPKPKSEPSKTTDTGENPPSPKPQRRAARPKKNSPTAATTTPPQLPPAQTQTTLPSQQVGDGIVNNAPNRGTQVVQDNRQYGVSPPPPDVDFHQSQVDPWPDHLLGLGRWREGKKIWKCSSGRTLVDPTRGLIGGHSKRSIQISSILG